ncbi:M23 family metallopeptidase [uncultured Desulfuromusa sp.]|uniref:M23 family metallopeptidase n=1 Tax=uncultured Desulfuromusa sp. TaxID=219183 RepID=UPI002AA69D74|nr:M23 family metallopeptidase [uncultured Desulfuromusa sp.]
MHKISSTVLLQIVNSVRKTGAPILPVCISLVFFLSACEAGIYHTVKPGQTLYRISRTYAVDEDYLARVNGIRDPSQISIGTRIFVPGAQRVLPVQVIKPKESLKTTAPVKKKTVVSAQKQPKIKKIIPSVVQPKRSKSTATPLKTLQWPLRGKIVRSFSREAKTGGGKGIEIAVRSGSDVNASAAGKVIYSGNGVNGYGFLVILQHENDLFTVYGFNQKNLVRQGDFVSKGERIALTGVPPSGGKARLHFEVRKGKVAVDPILYLP